MHHFVDAAALFVAPTITGAEATQLILRWFHFLAGIMWIGLLYFFNVVNVPFMKQVDAAAKPKIFQNMTLPALNWFRWSALLTVFFGFWYWAQFYVGPDAHTPGRQCSPRHRILPVPLAAGLGPAIRRDPEDGAQRLRARPPHDHSGLCRGLALREPHSGWRRRQPRSLHRRRRRNGHCDAVQCLGHHLAE